MSSNLVFEREMTDLWTYAYPTRYSWAASRTCPKVHRGHLGDEVIGVVLVGVCTPRIGRGKKAAAGQPTIGNRLCKNKVQPSKVHLVIRHHPNIVIWSLFSLSLAHLALSTSHELLKLRWACKLYMICG
ncbi:hypothetical protein PSHT_06565 [Puccinia striiformis]|uniref:Uncharacterized protein n=2 Tax=Puccinia striiformis TaxID=27350 RepID=A0A2S4W557_9BASI|nr:hypothetical protein PSTT_02077 [Puccinia striiformis]POW16915.1 hypothetical protein PSHT_06565 [Puccinia striiformis]